MGLLVDIMFPENPPDVAHISLWYKVIGAGLVTVGVMCMSLSEKIQEKTYILIFGRPLRNHYESIDAGSDV